MKLQMKWIGIYKNITDLAAFLLSASCLNCLILIGDTSWDYSCFYVPLEVLAFVSFGIGQTKEYVELLWLLNFLCLMIQQNLPCQGHKKWITGISWEPVHLSSPCRRFVSASKDGDARIWDVTLRKCVICLTGHTLAVTCVKWGGDGVIYTGYVILLIYSIGSWFFVFIFIFYAWDWKLLNKIWGTKLVSCFPPHIIDLKIVQSRYGRRHRES